MKRIVTLCLLFFLCSHAMTATGINDYKFQTISGFDNSGVNNIVEDVNGFVWMVTAGDVLRYDGYNFISYSNKIHQNDFVFIHYYAVLRHSNGDIYIASSNGVYLYVPETDSFDKVYSFNVHYIYEDRKGNLWFADNNDRIEIFFLKDRSYKPLMMNDSVVRGKIFTSPECGNIYILTSSHLISVDGHSGKITFVPNPYLGAKIATMLYFDDGLWILTERKGLWKYGEDQQFHLICTFKDPLNQKVIARCMMRDQTGKVWVGTMQGLFIFNPETKKISIYQHSDASGSLVNNSVWTIFEDNIRNIWIGTYGGISFLPHNALSIFNTISLSDFGHSQSPVSAFMMQGDKMWFGTEGYGLFRYEVDKGITAHYAQIEGKNSLCANNVKSMILNGNNLWIGTYLGGLDCLNTRTGVFTNYSSWNYHRRIFNDQITKLCPGDREGFWIIYQTMGQMLTYFSLTADTSAHYQINFPNSLYEQSRMIDITHGDKCLWLATNMSLARFSIANRTCDFFTKPFVRDHVLPPYIRTIYFQKSTGKLWIGTNNDGLIEYNIQSDKYTYYKGILQYGQVSICSIQDDKQGNLWLGTNNGIYRFDKYLHIFNHYDTSDGIQSPVSIQYATFLDDKGIIYMGGTGGYTWFDANKIKRNKFRPRTLISDIRINNRSVYEMSSVYAEKIVSVRNKQLLDVNWNEKDITIVLSSTNYQLSAKNRYRYFLKKEGLWSIHGWKQSSDWHEVGANERSLSLLNLSSGHYIFKAKSCNNDGVWGETIQLRIVVHPIFWASVWAYLIYMLVIALIIKYFVGSVRQSRKLKNEIYLTKLRKADEEKANQAKVRFFADVNGEFKEPLLRLLDTAGVENVPTIQLMQQTMDNYTSKYCIDTGGEKKKKFIESQLDKFNQMVNHRMAEGRIDIDGLALELGMSRRKLYNFIKENTGKSIIEYIRSYRISMAAKYMLEDNLSIKESIDRVGIESQSYFIKCFRQEYGDSPMSFVARMSDDSAKMSHKKKE